VDLVGGRRAHRHRRTRCGHRERHDPAANLFIGALPATLSYDGSNDLLDPTQGFRLAGRFSPEASFQGSAFGYSRFQLDASAYRPVGRG
jgi:outer membrane protein assembly factor BamA